jgi:putative hydrolase of HD superfamily
MLDKSLKFLKLLRELEEIKRVIYRPLDRMENDVEHSYQVAMMAWFWADQFNLDLSHEKLLKYGLAHDLVEAYAGDTPVYGDYKGINTIETKEKREAEALERIKKEFDNFSELIEVIEDYEEKKDMESVFIYELDKVIPALNLYLDDGYGWRKLGLTLEQVKKEKRKKVTSVKELVNLLEEALERFENEQEKLFCK